MRLLTLLALVGWTSTVVAAWHDDFSHNNPALYTNLNGSPDNLTITGGIARFDGVGGAFYGRSEFMYENFLQAEREEGSGATGIGWYNPISGVSISLLVDMSGTPTLSLIEHSSFGSPVILNSAPIQLGGSESLWLGVEIEKGRRAASLVRLLGLGWVCANRSARPVPGTSVNVS